MDQKPKRTYHRPAQVERDWSNCFSKEEKHKGDKVVTTLSLLLPDGAVAPERQPAGCPG